LGVTTTLNPSPNHPMVTISILVAGPFLAPVAILTPLGFWPPCVVADALATIAAMAPITTVAPISPTAHIATKGAAWPCS